MTTEQNRQEKTEEQRRIELLRAICAIEDVLEILRGLEIDVESE